jgi:tetratricopeptide (TPR) repeat protein
MKPSPSLLPIVLWLALMLAAHGPVRADELADLVRLHRGGETAAALVRADRYLASHPKDASMRFFKGVMLADSRRTTEAIEIFTQLSQDHPELAEPYNNLAALHASAGDYAKARDALELALRNRPAYAAAHENLGDVYAALAGRAYARALELEPSSPTLAPKLALVRQLISPLTAPGK